MNSNVGWRKVCRLGMLDRVRLFQDVGHLMLTISRLIPHPLLHCTGLEGRTPPFVGWKIEVTARAVKFAIRSDGVTCCYAEFVTDQFTLVVWRCEDSRCNGYFSSVGNVWFVGDVKSALQPPMNVTCSFAKTVTVVTIPFVWILFSRPFQMVHGVANPVDIAIIVEALMEVSSGILATPCVIHVRDDSSATIIVRSACAHTQM